jgi:hypothetical protein
MGRRFVIRTDQQSLRFLMEQRIVGEEYHKWLTKLLSFDFEIQYRPGKNNNVAHALSRKTDQVECRASGIPQWSFWPELKSELETTLFCLS